MDVLVAFAGCALCDYKNSDAHNFRTQPQGVKVTVESKNGFYREEKYSPAQFSIPSDISYSIMVELSGFTAKIDPSNVITRPSGASHSLFCALDFITPDTILYYKSLNESVKEADLPSMAILRLFSKELGDSIKGLPIKWFPAGHVYTKGKKRIV